MGFNLDLATLLLVFITVLVALHTFGVLPN